MASVVAVMARAPSLAGKSRLIQELGIRDGTGLRLALLRDTLELFSALDAAKAMVYTPPQDEVEIRFQPYLCLSAGRHLAIACATAGASYWHTVSTRSR